MVDRIGAEEVTAATELAAIEDRVIVLCTVVVIVEMVVKVFVEVILPEVSTVLSVQVVSTEVGTVVTDIEYVGADETTGTVVVGVPVAHCGCPSTNSEHNGLAGADEVLDTAPTDLDAGSTEVDVP